MKRKCLCGEIHDFQVFKRFRTTWGGKTTHYQKFCRKLGKLIVLTTTTYPSNITDAFCPSVKKYRKTETLIESREFLESGLYCMDLELLKNDL